VLSSPALRSPGFLLALALLLVNDWILKPGLANAITGKLSDFSGLFVVVVLGVALHPRHSRTIAGATAAAFVAWKSHLSQPAIDLWNQGTGFPLERVVDYWDLMALTVVPFAHRYASIARPLAPTPLRVPVLAACLLAILGTSKRPASLPTGPPPFVMHSFAELPLFEVATTRPETINRLKGGGLSITGTLGAEVWIASNAPCPGPPGAPRLLHAGTDILGKWSRSELRLKWVSLCRGDGALSEAEALAVFEAEVLPSLGSWKRRSSRDE
jgi:hypothetical protein